MGKATILPSGARNLERGQYRVRLEKADTRAQTEVKRVERELSIVDTTISEKYTALSNANNAWGNKKSDLDQIIQQSKESPEEDYSGKLTAVTSAEREAWGTLAGAKAQHQAARLKKRSLQGKKLYLDAQITEDIRTVWCADCQRTLSGTVATIEIPNTDQKILIRPRGTELTDSNYSAERDGQLRSVAAMSPAEAAWNYTMLPGWQKWKPLYRLAKILNIPGGGDKCTILIDAYSTAQSLATDVERTLYNVPLYYRGINTSDPYNLGDRVVVEFYNQNQEAPRVVGFESDPCTTSTTTSISTSSSTTTSSTSTTGSPWFLIWFDVIVTQMDTTFTPAQVLGGDPTMTITSKNSVPFRNKLRWVSPDDPTAVRVQMEVEAVDPEGYWLDGIKSGHLDTQYPLRIGSDQRKYPADTITPYALYTFELAYYEENTLPDVYEDMRITGNTRTESMYVKSNIPVDVSVHGKIKVYWSTTPTMWSTPFAIFNPPGAHAGHRCCVAVSPNEIRDHTYFSIDPAVYHPSYLISTNFGGPSVSSSYGPNYAWAVGTTTVPAPVAGTIYTFTILNNTALTTFTYTECACPGDPGWGGCDVCGNPVIDYLYTQGIPDSLIAMGAAPHIPS